MITSFMADTVIVVRSGTPVWDEYGNEVPGPPVETAVTGCAVLPPTAGATTEVTDGQQTVTVVRVLYAPAGADVRPMDKVRHAGHTYEVVGEPSIYTLTSIRHLEANLRAVSG